MAKSSRKPKFRGGFVVYVRDSSGANPRKKPQRRIPQYRRDLFVFVTEMGKEITAPDRATAEEIAVKNLWGRIMNVYLAPSRK